jgi:hypothetical protein
MRASLADILLLGYSILGPQVFGKSEIEMYLDAKEINKLLEKNLKRNPTSAIFLFFKSKFHKIVLKESEEAMKYVQLAHKYSMQIPEFQTLTFFEMSTWLNFWYKIYIGVYIFRFFTFNEFGLFQVS